MVERRPSQRRIAESSGIGDRGNHSGRWPQGRIPWAGGPWVAQTARARQLTSEAWRNRSRGIRTCTGIFHAPTSGSTRSSAPEHDAPRGSDAGRFTRPAAPSRVARDMSDPELWRVSQARSRRRHEANDQTFEPPVRSVVDRRSAAGHRRLRHGHRLVPLGWRQGRCRRRHATKTRSRRSRQARARPSARAAGGGPPARQAGGGGSQRRGGDPAQAPGRRARTSSASSASPLTESSAPTPRRRSARGSGPTASPPTAWPARRPARPSISAREPCSSGSGPPGPRPQARAEAAAEARRGRGPRGRRRPGAAAGARPGARRRLRPGYRARPQELAAQPRPHAGRRGRPADPLRPRPRRRRVLKRKAAPHAGSSSTGGGGGRQLLGGGPGGGRGQCDRRAALRLRRRSRLVRVLGLRLLRLGVLRAARRRSALVAARPRAPS